MSTSADRGLGPESDPGPWKTLELLTEVVDGIAAVQRDTLDALMALLALQGEQQAVLPGSAPEPEATEAQGPEPGLLAQTHQSRLQSSRLVARAHELAARTDQLTQQAEQIVNDMQTSTFSSRRV